MVMHSVADSRGRFEGNESRKKGMEINVNSVEIKLR